MMRCHSNSINNQFELLPRLTWDHERTHTQIPNAHTYMYSYIHTESWPLFLTGWKMGRKWTEALEWEWMLKGRLDGLTVCQNCEGTWSWNKCRLLVAETSCTDCTDRYMVFCQDAHKQAQEWAINRPVVNLLVSTSTFTKKRLYRSINRRMRQKWLLACV